MTTLPPSHADATQAARVLLSFLGANLDDPGTRDTPERMVKALCELTAGRHTDPRELLSVEFNAGAYAEAARSFEASYAAAESAEAAFNAALAHDRAGGNLMTMAWFRRYLAFDTSSTDKGYPHALRRVEELRARLGELRLQVESREPVRAVLVNGEPVLLTDFPRLVEPGRVDVRLLGDRADQVADILVEVAAGGTWTIHFTGFARAASEPVPRPETPPVATRCLGTCAGRPTTRAGPTSRWKPPGTAT